MPRSYLEQEFEAMIRLFKIPQPLREYNFHSFRFDFAWPAVKVCVEVDGGTFCGGNHVRGKGYQKDCIKSNLAHLQGWIVLRADREMVGTEEFAKIVKKMLKIRLNQKRTGRIKL